MNELNETTNAPLKRCAILGTAPSLAVTPWHDISLEMWGLNDAYLLKIPRWDRWYDLHPFHQMHFRSMQQGPSSSGAHSEPPLGAYLRPEGHLDWLKQQKVPVFMQQKRADFPTSRMFPKAELLEWFAPYWPMRYTRARTIVPGPDYEVSTPAWMLMQAIAEGYQEIHVYGIHLATEWEYLQQRPNFEFLLGIAAGMGRKIVLPDAAPICKASYQYAFAPKADLPQQRLQQQMAAIKAEGAALRTQYAELPWYAHRAKADLKTRLQHLDVALADARGALGRAQVLAAV